MFAVVWNVVEAFVAVGVGIAVGSVALVGFGVDSGIEVISAVGPPLEAPQGGSPRECAGGERR